MSDDKVMAVPRNRDSDDHMSSSIAAIEGRIEELEAELARVGPLALERDRLIRARAALLGEPPPATLRPTRRVTRDDVAAVLARHPGLRAGEIARALGAGQPAISAHLYRGKNIRFESRGARWFVRTSGHDR
jgi:DNA-binding transcriptional ArsR family regulator